jgi:chromosome segregation ATPase
MKKLFALAVLTAALIVATLYTTHPDEFRQATDTTAAASLRLWAGIEANPAPVLVALGTFMLTIVYHKLKGKSLRESVEVAATRVTVVALPTPTPVAPVAESENVVVKRAQARATRTQLIADQIGLENRLRKLPDDVRKSEQEVCYAEQAVTTAEEALSKAETAMEAKLEAESAAKAKLELLRKELAAGESELSAIAAELKKLADVV